MVSVPPRVPAGSRMLVLAVPLELTLMMTGLPIIDKPLVTMKVTFPVLGVTFPLVTLAVRVTDWEDLPL